MWPSDYSTDRVEEHSRFEIPHLSSRGPISPPQNEFHDNAEGLNTGDPIGRLFAVEWCVCVTRGLNEPAELGFRGNEGIPRVEVADLRLEQPGRK